MQKEIGTKEQLSTSQMLELFTPVEGEVCCYYGKIRNGKTRNATADIIELLKRGEVVYANWKIDLADYDERESFPIAFFSFFSRRKYFYKYKVAQNFHYFDPDDIDIGFLGKLVNVHIFIDEGQWIFNSHIKDQDPEKRKLILHNGHYCRSLNIITQRPINIFKDMRSQVNVWYRCCKRLDFGNWMIFQRWSIEDMKNDEPVEFDLAGKPLGQCKSYFVNKKHDPVFKAYNTHAMRAKDAIQMVPQFEVYSLTSWEKFKLMFRLFFKGSGHSPGAVKPIKDNE